MMASIVETCMYEIFGCQNLITTEGIVKHEETCEYKPVPMFCPFASCSIGLTKPNVPNHLETDHDPAYRFEMKYYEHETFKILYDMNKKWLWERPIPISAHGKTFYQLAFYDSKFQLFYFWLYLLGDASDASDFRYQYNVPKETLSYFGPVKSLQERYENIVELGRGCFAISESFTHKLVSSDKYLELCLKIEKNEDHRRNNNSWSFQPL